MTPKIYFEELSYALRREELLPRITEGDGLLPAEWNGHPLYRITESGAVRYDPAWVVIDQAKVALAETIKAAGTAMEYMALLESVLLPKAEYPEVGCRVLADFNGVALVGKETLPGAQSVTWVWGYDRRGLNNGHYYREDYQGVKEDLALRAGLVIRKRVFDQEQLEGLRQAVQGFLCRKAPASYQQEFQCRRPLDQTTAQLPEGTQDQMQSESQKFRQSM